MKFVSYVFHGSSSPCPGGGKRRFAFGIWVAVLAVAVVVGGVMPALATVKYIDNGELSSTELTDANSVSIADNTNQWPNDITSEKNYVVVTGTSTITVETSINLDNDVNLILCDEANLTINGGFTIADGKTLTIYAGKSSEGEITQASDIQGTGKLTVTGTVATESTKAGAGIGTATEGSATLVINGGEVSITGGKSEQSAGEYANGGIGIDVATVTINGGTVTFAGGTSTSGTAGSDINSTPTISNAPTINGVTYSEGKATYTVTFNAGEGKFDGNQSTATATVTATETGLNGAATLTEPSTSPTNGNKELEGWYTDSEFTEANKVTFSTTTITKDTTLYANWTDSYTITLNLGENATFTDSESTGWTTIVENKTTLTITSSTAATITLPTPTRDGYAFAGWTGDNLTKPTMAVTLNKSDVSDNLTYTATWINKGASATTAPSTTAPQVVYRSMILGGQIRVMFYVNIPTESGLTADDTCLMDFTVGNNTVTGIKSTKTMTEKIDGTDYTLYGYECPITSAQMADTISMKLRQGETEKDVLTTTITTNTAENYLNSLITTVANETYSNLGQAIRDYGYYVQLMLADEHEWGESTAWPHTAMAATGATDYSTGDKTIAAATTAVANYAITLKKGNEVVTLSDSTSITNMQFSLLLEDVTTIRLYMLPSASTTISKAEITQIDGTATTATELDIQDTDKTIGNKTGYKYVDITGIPAHELNKTYTVSITAGDDTYTVEVSALSYAHAVLTGSSYASDTVMQNAVTALYYYYAATDAYVNPDNDYPDYVGATDESYGD